MQICMVWPSAAFDWNQVRAFLATAEEGSLSAAARALDQTQPTIGRQVTALESDLGVTLFERAGHTLVLTQSGLELLEHARSMGDAAAMVSLSASGQSQAIEGQVRITASDVMSAYNLPPFLAHLRDVAPGIEVDIVASNQVRDLTRREADIAIRHVRPNQPNLIAKRVGEGKAVLCAGTSYLEKIGRPETISDLARTLLIGFDPPDALLEGLVASGLPFERANIKLASDSGIVVWELVKAGLGLAVMPVDLVETTPGVELVLPELAPFLYPVWLVTHRELHTSRRIRLVFDLLAETLSAYQAQSFEKVL